MCFFSQPCPNHVVQLKNFQILNGFRVKMFEMCSGHFSMSVIPRCNTKLSALVLNKLYFFFQILVTYWFVFFHHSISITHHSKYYTRLAPSLNFHHSIFFTLFVGPILVTHCKLFILFFIFYPNSLNLVKKKKKEKKK